MPASVEIYHLAGFGRRECGVEQAFNLKFLKHFLAADLQAAV
jgi:hypothetical protein